MQNLPFFYHNIESAWLRWGSVAPFFTLFSIISSLTLGLTSCREPVELMDAESGSLSFEINSSGFPGMRSLMPSVYLFSGIGPDGSTFSFALSETTASIADLKTGEWDVWVKGLDTNGDTILFGESTMDVKPLEEAVVNIALGPVEGFGSIHVTAEWPEEYAVDPLTVVSLTDDSGETTEYPLVTGIGGFSDIDIAGIPTGNYLAAVQLLDSGVLVTGSAWTVRVLNGMTVAVSAQFTELNKVGEKLDVTGDSFSIAWDNNSEAGTPDSFRIYFRHHGEEEWTFLLSVDDGAQQECTISSADLSYGTYEFAVSSVMGGVESDLHTSMDDNADPVCGWYINWS